MDTDLYVPRRTRAPVPTAAKDVPGYVSGLCEYDPAGFCPLPGMGARG